MAKEKDYLASLYAGRRKRNPELDQERKLFAELRAITQQTRHGEVGGIEIDLRHPAIDPELWGRPSLHREFLSRSSGPPLIFQWIVCEPLEKRVEKYKRNAAGIL